MEFHKKNLASERGTSSALTWNVRLERGTWARARDRDIPMGIPMGTPKGIPMGITIGIPMGIPMCIPMGIPMGIPWVYPRARIG